VYAGSVMSFVERSSPDSDRPPYSLKSGSTVGPYTLLSHIATGGMGQVWAARMRGVGGFTRICALKVIRAGLSEDPNYVAMFLDEANVAAAVHHPNVCEVLELGEENGMLFLAMEWVRGESLHALLAALPDGKLDLKVAARILSDTCAGLHAIHEATDEDGAPLRAIHRDVSPQNIMLTADGHVKVADLGISKSAKQIHRTTQRGKIKGKIAYVAPEQILGDSCDRRADVFAAGCVLYEATVGRKPFEGDTDVDTLRDIARGIYERPQDVLPAYPAALAATVEKALSLDPAARFQSAREFQLALEAWLNDNGQATSLVVAAVIDQWLGHRIQSRSEMIRLASSSMRAASTSHRSLSSAILEAHPVGVSSSRPGYEALPMAGVLATEDSPQLEHTTRPLTRPLPVRFGSIENDSTERARVVESELNGEEPTEKALGRSRQLKRRGSQLALVAVALILSAATFWLFSR
jgi:serine/threonine protein kinase